MARFETLALDEEDPNSDEARGVDPDYAHDRDGSED